MGELDGKFFKLVWSNLISSKVAALGWKVDLQRLPTLDNLTKRGIPIQNNTRGLCVMCKDKSESVPHLFFECRFTYVVWQSVYSWFGVDTVLPRECKAHFLQHIALGRGLKKKGDKLHKVIWFTVIWSIWCIRNNLVFKDIESSTVEVMDLIKTRS